MRYNKDKKHKHIEETLFNTQISGKISKIGEKSVSIQTQNDGECFLIVPINRVPKILLKEGTNVRIFLTTKYGHFGIQAVDSE